jgi:hypothetical protein
MDCFAPLAMTVVGLGERALTAQRFTEKTAVIARLDRATQYAAQFENNHSRVWNTGCSASRSMTGGGFAGLRIDAYLGKKLFAIAKAPSSSVSSAIFWASITSPATR